MIELDLKIDFYKKAGSIAAYALEEAIKSVKPGVSTKQLDDIAHDIILQKGGLPTFKGYRNFPATMCISINEEVVHGIPNKSRILKDGDIVSLDIGVTLKESIDSVLLNFIADTAVTVPCGDVSARALKLIKDTQLGLYAGIKAACAGNTLDEIGGAIEDVANANAYGLVREYGGHGIGQTLHEEPFIFNYRTNNRIKLKPGMVIAIEPMFNQGGDAVRTKSDGWTVVTKDYKFSAHFEHSLLITENKPIILTKRSNEVINE